jgi:hypothetical protein
MLRLIIGTGLAMTIALTGCDGGGGETKTKSVVATSPYIEQLKGLSDDNRGLALRRAVQDSNQACKRVVTSAYQQSYKNMSVWVLRCTDGEYALFIAPSGDVQVRTCTDVKTLKLLECRFEDAAPAKGKS